MMKRKLFTTLALAGTLLASVLILPVLFAQVAVATALPVARGVADWMVQSTLAQTLTLDEMSTQVSTLTTGNVPSLAIFIAFFVIIAAAAFFIGRLLRAAKA
jgi:hypothetical protein